MTNAVQQSNDAGEFRLPQRGHVVYIVAPNSGHGGTDKDALAAQNRSDGFGGMAFPRPTILHKHF